MALTRIQPPALADVREPNFRNIIINGDQSIAQRSTSVASISSGNTIHTCDRWKTYASSAGTWTQTQEALTSGDAYNDGFSTSLKLDCTTANGSLSAGSYLSVAQSIEAQNLQYIKKGTSSAQQLTASFWVKSTKTGTNILQLVSLDDTVRICAKSYTISSSDTWEKKTITFPADTSSTGSIDNNNGEGMRMIFWVAAGTDYTSGSLATTWADTANANRAVGQINNADSTSNNFEITAVQLEAGSVATDFEVISYDQNLERCYRYYEAIAENDTAVGFGGSYDSNTCGFHRSCSPKRATPSITQVSGTNYYRIYTGATVSFNSFSIAYANPQGGIFYATPTIADNLIGWFTCYNAAAKIALESEL
tara:strand:- start:152 stop:1246 length:1095 start_codon:yes stop_codon:yes gene_type:complete